MANPQPILFSPACHSHLLPSIADLHIACISHDAVIAYFTPPIEHSKVLKLWQEYASGVSTGDREIIVILAQDVVNNPSPDQEQQSEVAGVVMLGKPVTETGPFRGQVLKLFVSPSQRRLGIAKRLMMKLEEIAREQGKTLLVGFLDRPNLAQSIISRLLLKS